MKPKQPPQLYTDLATHFLYRISPLYHSLLSHLNIMHTSLPIPNYVNYTADSDTYLLRGFESSLLLLLCFHFIERFSVIDYARSA
jgi:hypothetical protein